ncbi:alpha-1,2-fucosyltransferase [Butyrivibrio fibrisolvens]|uniref:alpha-1,2-fucosyltransferase n=1 Tax=Butyrivibrio fibrisolvens TaxID=831 RepID=UPI000415E9CD|nr:alpha-1,2-fucosyltransferase [Butyrivibrio fibrisolvens]
MIIVGLNGGLGNQMFQYALYLKLKSLGKEVFIDDEILVNKLNNVKALKIFDVFDLEYDLCDKKTRDKMADVSIDVLSRLRRKYFGKRSHAGTYYHEDDLDNNYHADVLSLDDKYLEGNWQSEKYFEDIREIILKNYSFNISDTKLNNLCNEIGNCNSVSIHIRRGDYLGNSLYESICTETYYEKAIEYFKEHVNNPVFFIFSDDIEYAKKQYQGEEFVVIEGFYGNRSHYDMYLMSKCKYNIVANSSFSWWGAWLNVYSEKIVLCPEKWSTEYEFKYTPCDSWIKIGV